MRHSSLMRASVLFSCLVHGCLLSCCVSTVVMAPAPQMGTFILTFFSPAAPGRVTMVLFTWAVAFFFIFYGLARYYTRRTAIRNGLRDPADWEDAAAPALMAGALLLVVGSIVVYAFVTDQVPAKHAK